MAPVWGWIVAYVLGFLLFQLLIYWYLGEGKTSLERTTPETGERGPRQTVESRDTDHLTGGETVRCPHCGAENEFDPSYTYCRECTREYR
ncbi:hypothetical protein HLRTI_002272 [Halorhabdus tiamatea SARL4B]|uniref:DUF7577 domain-containing protein n=1 Tax=Halorhabdus tiamatea SARL4B TaxID=1033806 RepID=F7PFB5_9EURY|nr:hypothetical protein [Halorhabdus tiamatea]ERJ05745.1 hypothetical protein HLRTI_002272 [Halorhabdus tiamatea SARL4B]CCQ33931.1 hypothetical protein HTIA_1807 [Halorhabdus tiamatea SARL4B]